MIRPLLHDHFSEAYILVLIFSIGLIFSSCKQSQKDNILDQVYIEGIHDDPEILRADSFFLNGKLKEAASLFKEPRQDVTKQLYCQARLAEMDYYLRILYGKNHVDQVLDSLSLPLPITAIDSFLFLVYDFYSKERLDTAVFMNKWGRVIQQLGSEHYLSNMGDGILGEYFYRMNFNGELLDFYFKKYQEWCKSLPQKMYDCYWTNVRLTSSGTYSRNHLVSLAQSNELIEEKDWRNILDSIHLSYAYSARGYIQFRFDKFEEAFDDNETAKILSRNTSAVPVYQEALKSQMTVCDFWFRDTLWHNNISLLKENIKETGADYVNYERHIARFYHERENFGEAIPHQQLAIKYVLVARHLNKPVLESLCNLISIELEETGHYKEAIEMYRVGEKEILDKNVKYEDLIDSNQLNETYNFVSLARYGHIYYTWFLHDENPDLLAKAEELALLAHQGYYRDADTREESALITFSFEKNIVLELLCSIYAEKYFRFNDIDAFHKYHQYSEENRGAIFWKDVKSTWDFDSLLISLLFQEQQLNSENKRIKSRSIISQPDLEKNLTSLQNLHSEIRQKYPGYYYNSLTTATPSIEEIQDTLLNSNASLLAFDIIDHKIYLFWLQGCAEELFRIEITKDLYDQLISLISWMSTENEISAEEYAETAYSVWLKIIPDRVKSDTNSYWIIIPDNYFHRLNLEALVTGLDNSENTYLELKWLALKKDVTYTPLIKSWLHKKQRTQIEGKNVVGFSWSNTSTLDQLNYTGLPELPGCIGEMESLAKTYPGARIYTGEDATLYNFQKLYEHPNTRLIYLAMHGSSNSTRQDDICLYFRGESSKVDTFYGYELLSMKSNAETIILSACETAKGRIAEGEGNYNLPRYFLANGATEVFTSLWELDDQIIQNLIFEKNNGPVDDSFQEILKKNKIKMIQMSPRNSRPYYWANLIRYE